MEEQITTNLLNQFNWLYLILVNILTYLVIKTVDEFNGDKKVPTYLKRIILVCCIVLMASIFKLIYNTPTGELINSAILAPVFWSWICSPILKKYGFGYKDIDDTLK